MTWSLMNSHASDPRVTSEGALVLRLCWGPEDTCLPAVTGLLHSCAFDGLDAWVTVIPIA